MIEVFLSINNREEWFQLPVPPSEYELDFGHNNNIFESIQQGDLNTIGLPGLKEFPLESFFPVRDYPFLQDRTYTGMEYVEIIERWIARRLPIRVIISHDENVRLNINLPMTIERFTYRSAPDGDIYYSLQLKEFRFVNTKVGG